DHARERADRAARDQPPGARLRRQRHRADVPVPRGDVLPRPGRARCGQRLRGYGRKSRGGRGGAGRADHRPGGFRARHARGHDQPRRGRRARQRRSVAGAGAPPPAGLRRVFHRDARGDRPFTRGPSGPPSPADHDSRGHGPRVFGTRPRPHRVGRRHEALPLHVPARESLLPVGRADPHDHHDAGRRRDRSRGQARRPGRAPRRDGDGRGQAPTVPRARAPGGIVRARVAVGHLDVPAAMTATPITTPPNFLAFPGLVSTLFIVLRQNWRGRCGLFIVQSLLLAALATTIAAYAHRAELFLVAVIVVLLKAWLIPRVLRRMAAGTPARPVTPGRSAGLSLLAAGGLVVAAYVIMLPVTTVSELPTEGGIPLTFAMALIGLFVTVTGRDVLGHILGFLMFENGIFGLALLATYGLPGIVEAGVFLDVLVIVLIMEGVVLRIRREHDSIAVDRLR